MTYYFILIAIGAVMGIFGGLLGIGGSVVMIPALVLAFGENQHLYQAAAMICNLFVAASATIAHKRENIHTGGVIRYMIPAAVAGSVGGVLLSNAPFFSNERSYILARIFGLFLIYVIIQNTVRLYHEFAHPIGQKHIDIKNQKFLSIIIGLLTGISAGLLGLGGGVICMPLQQVLLKMPLKKAIANSAATIILIALVGSILKNATLYQHDIAVSESIKIAAVIIPSAAITSFIGARLVHVIPRRYIRIAFTSLMILACYRMLTA